MCDSTGSGSNASTTPWWEIWSWTTRRWSCPRTRTGSCSVTPPSPVARPRNASNFWVVSPSPPTHPNTDADRPPRPPGRPDDREGCTASYSHNRLQEPSLEGMNVTLNNGVEMPALGFGVFQTPPETTSASVTEALRVGYRVVDTAASSTSARSGRASAARVWTGRRSSWRRGSGSATTATTRRCTRSTRVPASSGSSRSTCFCCTRGCPPTSTRRSARTTRWRCCWRMGGVLAIGVSNFMPEHLTALLERSTVVPAVNQIEVHPYFTQPEAQKTDAEHGILTQAWSPMGGITSYRGDSSTSTFNNPEIGEIAAVHGKTPAQVMLRWHLQEGRSAIPKSINPKRIASNFDVFDFELTADQLAAIDALDKGVRGGPEPEAVTLEAFHRDIPEA